MADRFAWAALSRTGGLYHVYCPLKRDAAGRAVAGCGARLMDDDPAVGSNWVRVTEIGPTLRCQRIGCVQRWPRWEGTGA